MPGWRVVLWAALVGVALVFLFSVRSVLLPFLVALVLSAILDPMVRRLQRKGYPRRKAVFQVSSAFFLTLLAFAVWLTPVISNQVLTFKDKIDTISAQLASKAGSENFFVRWNPKAQSPNESTEAIDRLFEQNRDLLHRVGMPTSRRQVINEYVEPHRQELTKAAQTFFGGVLGLISGLGSQALLMLFSPIFAVMMLLELDKFKGRAASMIPPSIRLETLELLKDVSNVFVNYLRGVSIVLVYYAIAAAIVLTVLGVPYSLLLAALFAVLYLIPYLGPLINATLILVLTGFSGRSGNMLWTMSNPWSFAVTITIIYMALGAIFDQAVYTRIVGNSVGLHPLVSFFVVFSGAALFGPMGMILAFPVAGAVKIILDRLLKVTSKTQELQLPPVPLRHRNA